MAIIWGLDDHHDDGDDGEMKHYNFYHSWFICLGGVTLATLQAMHMVSLHITLLTCCSEDIYALCNIKPPLKPPIYLTATKDGLQMRGIAAMVERVSGIKLWNNFYQNHKPRISLPRVCNSMWLGTWIRISILVRTHSHKPGQGNSFKPWLCTHTSNVAKSL